MKKYLKIVLLVIVAIILVGTFVFLYQKSRPKVVVYETLKPEVTDLQKTTVATGKVEPRDEILIKPQISGIIDEVYKEAGQAVRKGEVIAKVKVIPELGQLNSAESRVRLAEINATQAETDFSLPAVKVKQFILGMNPAPVAYAFCNGKKIKIYRAKALNEEFSGKCGEVVKADKKLIVKCGSGAIEITEIQEEGGKKLSARDFTAGRKLAVGDVLGKNV